MDYIKNLKDPAAFSRMVSRLAENISFQNLSESRKDKLLQRLASKREQKPALQGETGVSPETLMASNSEGDASTYTRPSGVASEASGQRVVEGLVGLGEEAALQGAVTGGAAMALGGLDLDQAMEVALNPANIGRGVLMGIPDIAQAGMGIGRDLGFAGHLGKGILSMALGAINPALGVVANAFGTSIADFTMDALGARGFEEQKEGLENLMGELPARAGIDYAGFNDIPSTLEGQDISITELRDQLQEMYDAGMSTQSLSATEKAKLENALGTLNAGSQLEQRELAIRDYRLQLAQPQPNVDRLNVAGQKLREFGVDPTKLTPYQELSGFESIFGEGSYDRMSRAAKERIRHQNKVVSAKMMKESLEEYENRLAVADKYGLKTLTGTKIAEAIQKEKKAKEAKEKQFKKYKDRGGGADREDWDKYGSPNYTPGNERASRYSGNSDGDGGSRGSAGAGRGGGFGDRTSSPGGMGGV